MTIIRIKPNGVTKGVAKLVERIKEDPKKRVIFLVYDPNDQEFKKFKNDVWKQIVKEKLDESETIVQVDIAILKRLVKKLNKIKNEEEIYDEKYIRVFGMHAYYSVEVSVYAIGQISLWLSISEAPTLMRYKIRDRMYTFTAGKDKPTIWSLKNICKFLNV